MVLPDTMHPNTTVRGKGNYQILLGFNNELPDGDHRLLIYDLYNLSQVPFYQDTLEIVFSVTSPLEKPYLQKLEMLSKQELLLQFSQNMDKNSVENIENYRITPDDQVIEARLHPDAPKNVTLFLTGKNRMGNLGYDYYLEITGLRDVQGIEIAEDGTNRILIRNTIVNLDQMIVFPNPLRSGSAENMLHFGNVPYGCDIIIYTANGETVRRLKNSDFNGAINWDLKNETGEEVRNGVYLYVASYGDQKKVDKFMILK
jgi:hypothetical protein